jgi:hypothetical protein
MEQGVQFVTTVILNELVLCHFCALATTAVAVNHLSSLYTCFSGN